MPKRNITGRSGKQLYLNKLFLRGMLYSSSEMQEGYAKLISNFDISPTGDSATPRFPYRVANPRLADEDDKKDTIPIKFSQDPNRHYYATFRQTITEEEFWDGTLTSVDNQQPSIDIKYRQNNALNQTETLSFNSTSYYERTEDSDDENTSEDPSQDTENQNKVKNNTGWDRQETGLHFKDYFDGAFNNTTSIKVECIKYISNAIGTTVVGVNNPDSTLPIQIPFEVKYNNGDYSSVTAIGVEAFQNCKADIIVLPGTVNLIKDRAFKNCEASVIVIPNEHCILGKDAFRREGTLKDKPLKIYVTAIDNWGWETGIETSTNVEICFYNQELLDAARIGGMGYLDGISGITFTLDTGGSTIIKSFLGTSKPIDYNLQSVFIEDGDTFKYEGKAYRLYGVNTPEKGYEWSYYAKAILSNILKSDLITGISLTKIGVSFDRDVVKAVIMLSDPDTGYFYTIDVSTLLLQLGLGTVWNDSSYRSNDINILRIVQTEAITHRRRIMGDTGWDPFHNYMFTSVGPDTDNKPFIMKKGYSVDIVKYSNMDKSNSYSLSHNVEITVDRLSHVFVDYLDALAFIGRIRDGAGDIIYKGIIMLKLNGLDEDDNPLFIIHAPNDNLQGETPGLIDAASSGYNLLNDEMIHVDNPEEDYMPFYIKGLAVLNPHPPEGVTEVVTQGVMGQEVILKPIINEKGYYNYNQLVTTSSFRYKLNVKISDSTETNTIKEVELNNILSLVEYDVTSETSSFKVSLSSFSITLPEGETVEIPITSPSKIFSNVDGTKQSDYRKLINGCVLDMALELSIIEEEENKYIFTAKVYDNFNKLEQAFDEDDVSDGDFTTSDRDIRPDIHFYGKWSYAPFGTEDWVDIRYIENRREQGPEYLLYSKTADTDIVKEDGVDASRRWFISTYKTSVLKFTIIPRASLLINESCPEQLRDKYVTNVFQEITVIQPNFSIGNRPMYVSTKDLTRNIDFKNASRIGIFNRQLFVYGPKTKANFIQFSGFEKEWYYPFPFGTINFDEPIVHVVNFADSLVVFGQHNIYMLSGGVHIQECAKIMIYEKLSINFAESSLVQPVGSFLMFFNRGMGYIIVPNQYSDDPANVKIYKLTEAVNQLLIDPENYLRLQLGGVSGKNIDIKDRINKITITPHSYAQNNQIYLVMNYTILVLDSNTQELKTINTVSTVIYNQDYKYWRLYHTPVFDTIKYSYVCEPQLNHQFIVKGTDGNHYIAYLANVIDDSESGFYDKPHEINSEHSKHPITCLYESGYLSVDTMNDKRFKDLIIEFDRIQNGATLIVDTNFYIDGEPILLADTDTIPIDRDLNTSNLKTDKVFSSEIRHATRHITTDENTLNGVPSQVYGVAFKINGDIETATNRSHLRIPIFGMGRLPSFTMKFSCDDFYEFINYSIVYKEKNINRRR